MEGFSSILNDTFTSTRGCAEPMCQLKVKVTVKGKILNKQIFDIMFCLLCKSYTNGKKSLLSIPLMAGYPSNLAKKFSPTERFPQQILPLLPLYNEQWWGYESLTAIVLVVNRNVCFLFCWL